MNAARIAIAAITPSPTNPRKRFDQAAIDELADSIKRYDVLQPILLRRNGTPDTYELVAGERRYRAAKQAGLVDIPATVRELSDADVLEIQVVENLQRKDLHELEEAEGYEQLLRCTHAGGERYTVEEIAAKVGKSRSYVFGRLKLCALCPEAKKAFYAGELDASRALLIARIGHHDTQRQALKDLTKGRYGSGEPMSYRDAHEHILRNFTLQLKAAPFDLKDEHLMPKAGSCTACPKRTGNQADLFGDVKGADVCTDPKCFSDKRIAHHSAAAIALEAKGKKVIHGEAAKKAFPGWDSSSTWQRDELSDRYVPLKDTVYVGNRARPARDLLGAEYEPIIIQHPATGQMVEVATRQAVDAAQKSSSGKKGNVAAKAKKATKPKGPDVDDMLTERLAALVREKAPKTFDKAWLHSLAELVLDNMGMRDLEAVAGAWGWSASAFKKSGGYGKRLPAEASKLPERDLVLLMFHLVFATGAYNRKPVLKLFGIEEARVREQIIEERKAARSAKPVPTVAKKTGLGRGMPAVTPVITPLIKPRGSKEVLVKAKKKAPAKAKKPKQPDFMKPMTPTAELAAIVGDKPMPRTEVTSKLWGYIKKNNLQDKVNRRMINVDAKLQPLFGTKKQVSMFEMTKHVAKHLK